MNSLSLKTLRNIPEIEPGMHIPDIIINNIINENLTLSEGDIFVIAQKVISKAENRYVNLKDVKVSNEALLLSKKVNKKPEFIQVVINESNKILSSKNNILVTEHKLGFTNINAGIDMSNIKNNKEQVLLLPDDPNKSALMIKEILVNKFKINIDIIISDSMTRPQRYGITGFAIGSSNINCLLDKKGCKDMFGNDLHTTEIAIGDELAAAASILMGQCDEKKPIVIVSGYKDTTDYKNNAKSLALLKKDDIYSY